MKCNWDGSIQTHYGHDGLAWQEKWQQNMIVVMKRLPEQNMQIYSQPASRAHSTQCTAETFVTEHEEENMNFSGPHEQRACVGRQYCSLTVAACLLQSGGTHSAAAFAQQHQLAACTCKTSTNNSSQHCINQHIGTYNKVKYIIPRASLHNTAHQLQLP